MVDPTGDHIKNRRDGALGFADHSARGIDQLGDHVSVRSWSTGAILAMGLVILAPTTASAAPPVTTPGQSGVSGCAANGAAISGAAQALEPGAFGEMASGAAPIADENALFFGMLCSEG
jgi:hypothetical protein